MNNILRQDLEKTRDGKLVELNGNKYLLVVFGGIQQGIGVPVFEFFNSLSDVNCDKIFFRDFNQAWYQRGVDEELTDIDSIESYLKGILSNKYERVCFVGNSMGGYGAILFGTLLEVDQVIAFAPQTFIDRWHRFLYFDLRWRKELRNVFDLAKGKRKYLDLKEMLKNSSNKNTNIKLYYSSSDRLDKIHASRMSDCSKVDLISVKQGGHGLVKTLRDTGELTQILVNALLVD